MPQYIKLAVRSVLVLSLSAGPAGVGYSRTQSIPQAPKNPIHVTTKEVTVPVTVTDRHGELVLDLTQADFHVLDDGIEQKIDHCELGGDPLATVLLIETNSHLQPLANSIHSLGIVFADAVMALDGEAAVITYDSTATIRQPFATAHEAVEKAIETTKFDGSEMNLYDGIATGERLLTMQPKNWHRVMLIVGESRDSGSIATLGQVVREAERADISIYVLGVSSVAADLRGNKLSVHPLKIRGLPPITAAPCNAQVPGYGATGCLDLATPALWLLERGTNEIKHHQLAVAATATGGAEFGGFRESALQSALDRIGSELHAQYVLSYKPNAGSAPGFHRIRVTVSRADVSVRARPGYFLTQSVN